MAIIGIILIILNSLDPQTFHSGPDLWENSWDKMQGKWFNCWANFLWDWWEKKKKQPIKKKKNQYPPHLIFPGPVSSSRAWRRKGFIVHPSHKSPNSSGRAHGTSISPKTSWKIPPQGEEFQNFPSNHRKEGSHLFLNHPHLMPAFIPTASHQP